MKANLIRHLLNFLPANSSYLSNHGSRLINTETGGSAHLKEIEKQGVCLLDPTFGWHFVRAFVEVDKPMPGDVNEQVLLRAYDAEKNGRRDTEMQSACVLKHPHFISYRNVIEALLLCPDMKMKKIAELAHLPNEVISLYDDLFFNVRDRITEKLYINSIVYRQTRNVELQERYGTEEEAGMLMKRLAVNSGSDAVLNFAGVNAGMQEFNSGESANRLESMVMSNGTLWAKLGLLNQNQMFAPGITHALGIIRAKAAGGAEETSSNDALGLSGMSAGRSILDHATKSQEQDIINRRLLRQIHQKNQEVMRQKSEVAKEANATAN